MCNSLLSLLIRHIPSISNLQIEVISPSVEILTAGVYVSLPNFLDKLI